MELDVDGQPEYSQRYQASPFFSLCYITPLKSFRIGTTSLVLKRDKQEMIIFDLGKPYNLIVFGVLGAHGSGFEFCLRTY